jgi:multicomponent Na+:H+ antiporter subunit G
VNAVDVLVAALLLAGAFFFLAGTVGLLRFPDTLSRLHALTKADNLGLGFIVLALVIEAASLVIALKLIAIWVLVLLASSSACYLIADDVRDKSGIVDKGSGGATAGSAPDAGDRA